MCDWLRGVSALWALQLCAATQPSPTARATAVAAGVACASLTTTVDSVPVATPIAMYAASGSPTSYSEPSAAASAPDIASIPPTTSVARHAQTPPKTEADQHKHAAL